MIAVPCEPRPLIAWLASLPPGERDAAFEKHLGISELPSDAAPGEHLIGYHPSSVAAIVRLLIEVPLSQYEDVFIDLGAGLGKVVLLTRMLTEVPARGIELQESLVQRARAAAASCNANVRFVLGDVRTADLHDGTVFFMYAPFTGPVLTEVLRRLHEVASQHAIVVCTLGLDLDAGAPWLRRRAGDAFWLTIYDSIVAGVLPRADPRDVRGALSSGGDEAIVAFELPAPAPRQR